MNKRNNRRFRLRLANSLSVSALIWFLSGCSYFLLQDIFIPMNFVASDSTLTDSTFSVDGRTWVWQAEGVKIELEQMTDPMLNALFPEASKRGEYSTNPYTFGDWVDLEAGYTPAKFTVFAISIFNYLQPKIELDPRKIELVLDNSAVLKSYGLDQYDEPPNIERYLIANKGSSGNERRRFKEKIGMAKQTILVKTAVFKGGKSEGLIVFDPLPPEIQKLSVAINDLVMGFDSNNWPSNVRSVKFPFNRSGSVDGTANEIKAPMGNVSFHGTAQFKEIEDLSGGSRPDTNAVQVELNIRNQTSYDNLLRVIRSDIRFYNAILDVQITTTGTMIVNGFLNSTGDPTLDENLKMTLETLTFEPLRMKTSKGNFMPIKVPFQLSFGLTPLFPQIKFAPNKIEIHSQIGSQTQIDSTRSAPRW